MKALTVKTTLCVLALIAAVATWISAQAPSPTTTLQQLERDWSNAQRTGDIERLRQIVADDWIGLGSDGIRSTKSEHVGNIQSGATKLESFEFGPMDVKLIGTTVAIVQGSDTESSSFNGNDTSGTWAWTDVFELRSGQWQAVRSQTALIK